MNGTRKCLLDKVKAGLILMVLIIPFEAVAAEYIGDIMQYSSKPPFLPSASDPNIHFLIDTSADMLRPAYGICDEKMANCEDNFFHTADDYDPHRPYFGTYDNNYSHLEDAARKKELNAASYPYKYDDSLAYKYSYYDVGSNEGFRKDAAGAWNGNWLNWFAMTQMDVMKAVLVGGKISPTPETANNLSDGNIATLMSYLDDLPNDGKMYKVVSEENSSDRLGYTNFTTPQEVTFRWYSTPTSASMEGYSTLQIIFGSESVDDVVREDPNGLPFAFKLFTTTYAAGDPVYISSNGVFGFSTSLTGAQYANNDIPDSAVPNSIIALHWDDLYVYNPFNTTISTFTVGEAPNRIYVVSYDRIKHYSDSGQKDPMSFQALLFENSSEIIFQYQDVSSTEFYGEGKSATIGVENSSGTKAKKHSYCNDCISDVIEDGMALHMTPGSMVYEIVPSSSATLFRPAGALATGSNTFKQEVLSYVSDKPAEGCDTTIGKYPNTSEEISDLCSDHPLEGLFHDLRAAAATEDLGFRLTIMEAGYNDNDGGEIIAPANSIIAGSHFNPEIGQLRNKTPGGAAPLGEAMAESMSYFKQAAPIWSSDYSGEGAACAEASVGSDGTPDPYCDRSGEMIYCCRSFVLLLSSGLYRDDFGRNVYNDDQDTVADSGTLADPPSGMSMAIDGSNEGLPSNGGWLDNVAYKAHVTDIRPELDEKQDLTLYVVNTYGEGVGKGTTILKRAAKYGGFNDKNRSNTYDAAVYDCNGDGTDETGEEDRNCDGMPDTYFEPSGDESVKDKITQAIESILKGAASGTSVSVLSTSAGGQGAVYQAYFYPSKIEGENETRDYTGYMRAFFMDKYQNLRDDASGAAYVTNSDGTTTYSGTPDARLVLGDINSTDKGDYVAQMHLDDENLVRVYLTEDDDGLDVPYVTDTNHVPDPLIDELQSVWEAGKVMAMKTYSSRDLYTWVDLNLDGIIDNGGSNGRLAASNGEIMTFDDSNKLVLAKYIRAADPDGVQFTNASGVVEGFLNLTTEAEDIIDYVRGEFVSGYRNRCVTIAGASSQSAGALELADYPASGPAAGRRELCGRADGEVDYSRVWPLGDIIYSTPTLVSGPSERYDQIYGSASYLAYKKQYVDRRNVIYVGANDGMLHAFNAGFFDPEDTKFCVGNVDTNGDGEINGDMGTASSECAANGAYDLGEEMWGFIPYENLPHLAWLACNGGSKDPSACGNSEYQHVFFMDQRPKASDVKIWPETGDSAHPGGWGTILVVGMRYGGGAMNIDFNNNTSIDMAGEKIRSAYYVFDVTDPEVKPELLYRFTDDNMGFTTSFPAIARTKYGKEGEAGFHEAWFLVFGSGPKNEIGDKDANRDYNSDTTTSQEGYVYVYELGGGGQSRKFSTNAAPLSDTSVIMGDPSVVDVDLDFSADVIYIGSAISETGGKVYRINTRSVPVDTADPTVLNSWPGMTVLFEDADMGPLFTPPSSSMDAVGNYWVFFGTGRLRNSNDVDNTDVQRFYGIKEECWEQTNSCFTSARTNKNYEIGDLYQSNDIQVDLAGNVTESVGACGGSCTFDSLVSFARSGAKKGWYFELPHDGTNPSERVLARSAILGGLLMFTTYTPISSACDIFGTSKLYALYFETGSAYNKPVFEGTDSGGTDINATEIQKSLSLGAGMPTAIGVAIGETVTGFVQKSTGEIIRVQAASGIGVKSGTSSWREKTTEGGTVEIEETYKHIVK